MQNTKTASVCQDTRKCALAYTLIFVFVFANILSSFTPLIEAVQLPHNAKAAEALWTSELNELSKVRPELLTSHLTELLVKAQTDEQLLAEIKAVTAEDDAEKALAKLAEVQASLSLAENLDWQDERVAQARAILVKLAQAGIVDYAEDLEGTRTLVNPELVTSGENLTTKTTQYTLSASTEQAGHFQIQNNTANGAVSVGYVPFLANDAEALVAENKVLHKDIWNNTDLLLTTTPEGVKEDLILKNPNAPREFAYGVALEGLKPRITDEGSLEYVDANDQVQMYVPAPTIYDVNGQSRLAEYKILSLSEATDWLNAQSENYAISDLHYDIASQSWGYSALDQSQAVLETSGTETFDELLEKADTLEEETVTETTPAEADLVMTEETVYPVETETETETADDLVITEEVATETEIATEEEIAEETPEVSAETETATEEEIAEETPEVTEETDNAVEQALDALFTVPEANAEEEIILPEEDATTETVTVEETAETETATTEEIAEETPEVSAETETATTEEITEETVTETPAEVITTETETLEPELEPAEEELVVTTPSVTADLPELPMNREGYYIGQDGYYYKDGAAYDYRSSTYIYVREDWNIPSEDGTLPLRAYGELVASSFEAKIQTNANRPAFPAQYQFVLLVSIPEEIANSLSYPLDLDPSTFVNFYARGNRLFATDNLTGGQAGLYTQASAFGQLNRGTEDAQLNGTRTLANALTSAVDASGTVYTASDVSASQDWIADSTSLRTDTIGAKVLFTTATATEIWAGLTYGSMGGVLKVSIDADTDNEIVNYIDTYNSVTLTAQKTLLATGLMSGTHTVEITLVPTTNVARSGTNYLFGLEYLETYTAGNELMHRHTDSSATSAGTTTTLIDTNLSASADYYLGSTLTFLSGALEGEVAYVTDFDVATHTVTFTPAMTTATTLGVTYKLVQGAILVNDQILSGLTYSATTTPNGVTYSATENLQSASGSFSAWVRPQFAFDSDSAIHTILNSSVAKIYYDGADDCFHFSIFDGTDWSKTVISASQNFLANDILHVGATWNNTVGLKIYVNNYVTSTSTTWTEQAVSGDLTLGGTSTDTFGGVIAEVQIFDYSMRATEMGDIYYADTPAINQSVDQYTSHNVQTADTLLFNANLVQTPNDTVGTLAGGALLSSTVSGEQYTLLDSTGTGTADDPYMIYSCSGLQEIANDVSAYYELAGDIDCSATSTWNSGAGFAPISAFAGNFDGKGHAIYNLFINLPSTDLVGLFTYTDGADIANVGLVNVNITGQTNVGGLTGYNYNFSTITNSYTTGKVTGTGSNIGGLVGQNTYSSTITNSHSDANVSGVNYTGGLAGYQGNSASVSDSYATGNITSTADYAGGFAGYIQASSATRCYANGNVNAANMIGGFVGRTDNATITDSYATGAVNGTAYVGGFVGNNNTSSGVSRCYAVGKVTSTSDEAGGFAGRNYSSATISDSYTNSDVTSSGNSVGGFVGYNSANITNVYASGNVTSTLQYTGGLVGRAYSTGVVTNSYAVGNVSGSSTYSSYTGRLYGLISSSTLTNSYYWSGSTCTNCGNVQGTAEATLANFYATSHNVYDTTAPNWNFTTPVWYALGGLPKLSADPSVTGTGTSTDPYVLYTCAQLQNASANLSAYYELGRDIDCSATKFWNSGYGFDPIGDGTTAFTGHFDGKNHKVINLYINRISSVSTDPNYGSYVGLFGYNSNATIQNIGVVNADIKAYQNAGILVGENSNSTIDNAYTNGVVNSIYRYTGGLAGDSTGASANITNSFSATKITTNDGYTGGLVGRNVNGSTISKSYATGNVSGVGNYIGGLIGVNNSSAVITDCYATGNVVGSNTSTGGLVGYSGAIIRNSYAKGTVTGGSTYVGGLVGRNISTGSIQNSYSVGNVSGNSSYASTTGRLIGAQENTLTNSYYWSGSTCTNCSAVYGTAEATLANFYATTQNVYDSTAPYWDFAGTWNSYANALPDLKTVTALTSPLAEADFVRRTITTSDNITTIVLGANTKPNAGIVRVIVDAGTPRQVITEIDTYSATTQSNQRFLVATGLNAGVHTVKVERTNTANPSATSTLISPTFVEALATGFNTQSLNVNGRLVDNVITQNSALNNHVVYPAQGNLATEAGTLEFWATSGTLPASKTFLNTRDDSNYNGLAISTNSGSDLVFTFANASASVSTTAAGAGDYSSTQANHILARWYTRGANFTMSLYLNGKKIAESTQAFTPSTQTRIVLPESNTALYDLAIYAKAFADGGVAVGANATDEVAQAYATLAHATESISAVTIDVATILNTAGTYYAEAGAISNVSAYVNAQKTGITTTKAGTYARLNGALTATTTTFSIDNIADESALKTTGGFAYLGSAQSAQREKIYYTNYANGTFTGVVRGVNDTSASAWADDTIIEILGAVTLTATPESDASIYLDYDYLANANARAHASLNPTAQNFSADWVDGVSSTAGATWFALAHGNAISLVYTGNTTDGAQMQLILDEGTANERRTIVDMSLANGRQIKLISSDVGAGVHTVRGVVLNGTARIEGLIANGHLPILQTVGTLDILTGDLLENMLLEELLSGTVAVNAVKYYDTSLDTDSTWRLDNTTSWYAEAGAYPEVSYLIASDSALFIFNGETDLPWMTFIIGAGNVLDSTVRSLAVANGVVYAGTDTGMVKLDFANDTITKLDTAVTYDSGWFDFTDRNSTEFAYTNLPETTAEQITTLALGEGILAIGTHNTNNVSASNVYIYNLATGAVTQTNPAGAIVNAVYVDTSDNVYYATASKVVKFAQGTSETTNSSLGGYALASDGDSLFVGTNNGVAKLSLSNVSTLNATFLTKTGGTYPILSGTTNVVKVLSYDAENARLLVGTNNGVDGAGAVSVVTGLNATPYVTSEYQNEGAGLTSSQILALDSAALLNPGMYGSGTASDPFIVTTCAQLQSLSKKLAAYYELGNDLDCSVTRTWDNGYGFRPIGNNTKPFTGHFDGADHTISNLYINRTSSVGTDQNYGYYMGLFGYTSGATIENLILDAEINAVNYVGALVGYATSSSTINNVQVSGSIIAASTVGGLLGFLNASTVSASSADVEINVTGGAIGGLIGDVESSATVTDSFATGNVISSNGTVGGLAGLVSDSTVTRTYSTGNVTGANYVGGLVGQVVNNSITDSFATGAVLGNLEVGGLVGRNRSTIQNSYATGATSGNGYLGGLVGQNYTGATTKNSYSVGNVTNLTSGTYASTSGRLVGAQNGTLTNAYYWSGSTCTACSATNGTAEATLTNFYDKTHNVYDSTTPYWDFISPVWYARAYNFPQLTAEYNAISMSGAGTSGDPYIVTNCEELQSMGSSLASYYELGNDLDCSESVTWNNPTFTQKQAIATNGASDWESFEIDGVPYLAVANYSDGSIYNLNSYIYQWNGTDFVQFQTIATSGAYDWESFTIGADTYLVVANYYNGSSYNINSVIYKWNGSSFAQFQTIATHGAYDWESFTIGADTYLVVANYRDGSTYNLNSVIYKWNGSSFVSFQNIATVGASDWESFEIDGVPYLAVASIFSGSTYDLNSLVYKWNGSTFAQFQTIATHGAYDWESFTIGADTYLAVANYRDGSTYNLNSVIYKWNGSSFASFQNIATNGAIGWESFTVGSDTYLAVANYYNGTTRNTDSVIYKWNGSSFASFQTIPTIGAFDWGSFTIGADTYLAVASYRDDSTYNTNSYLYRFSGYGFDPVGNDVTPFTGHFDGKNHVISNLYINRTSEVTTDPNYGYHASLLGFASGATIQNVGLENVNINGTQWTAGLVGYVNLDTNITNAYTTGSVVGATYVGGLVGQIYGSNVISNSHSDARVFGSSANGRVGGLVGHAYGGALITNSYATGDVTSTDGVYVGGLVGINYSSNVSKSYATGNVYSNGGTSIGGLVGYSNGSGTIASITDSYSTGNVTSTVGYAGGLVGRNYSSNITNSYTTGNVSANGANVGGLVGYDYGSGGTIKNSYATGTVANATSSYTASTGRLMGTLGNTLTNSYYWSGSICTNCGTTFGTAEATLANFYDKTQNVYDTTSPLWDFTTPVWYAWGTTTPRLSAEFTSTMSGSGTALSPYIVTNCEELQLMRNNLASYYELANDVDCSATTTWGANSNFKQKQAIATNGASDWESFEINGVSYLAVASTRTDASWSTNSVIYKWNGTDFVQFQSIATVGAFDLEHFMIGSDHYLAVASAYSGSSYSTNSVIYKWDGDSFENFQTIATSGAYDWESFTIGSDTYLAVANYYNGSTCAINSVIYKWNGSTFVQSQTIATNCATDWQSFTIGADTYLAVANSHTNSSWPTDSVIYKWNGSTFVQSQTIATNGAYDWESFTIGADTYLAVANYYNGSSYNINSVIYKWNGSTFASFQNITTAGAHDWKAFTIGADTYLAVANYYNGSVYNTNSIIYKWNGSTFASFQTIATNGAFVWESFTAGDQSYLALANQYHDTTGYSTNSKIYRFAGYGFDPIGDATTAFTGHFDGKNHTISDLYINRTSSVSTDQNYGYNVGLFGNLSGATVQNLKLTDADIQGYQYVAGVAGYSASSTVSYASAQGSITGNTYVGGLVGRNNTAYLRNSSATGQVTGVTSVGGLVGFNNASAEITDSYAENNVTGTSTYIGGLVGQNASSALITRTHSIGKVTGGTGHSVGGLVGYNSSSTISNSYSNSSVNSGNSYTGGLVGQNNAGTITNTYATGTVTTPASEIGGLVGFNTGAGAVTNSYFAGSVSCNNDSCGGLIGYNSASTITNSYSVGNLVNAKSTSAATTGRLTGQQTGTITNSYYWSGSTCTNCSAVTGTAEATLANFYATSHNAYDTTAPNWDFTTPVWYARSNDLPKLTAQITLSGSGTAGSPYLVGTCTELQSIQNNLSAYYTLTADIDCAETATWNGGYGFDPIGDTTTQFTGHFDGNGHTISNLYINRTSSVSTDANYGYYTGLFGYITNATVANVGMLNTNINGYASVGGLVGSCGTSTITNSYVSGKVYSTGPYVGGLLGFNEQSTLSKSYATANVTTDNSFIGGLVGYVHTGSVTDSYATGTVLSTITASSTYAGGLVGYTNTTATLTNSYATGDVTGSNYYIGGLVGRNNSSTITNAYSTGNVSGNSSYSTYVGRLVGGQNGTLTNSYYYSGSTCTNCASVVGTAEATLANFYATSHNAYDTTAPNWDFTTPVWYARSNTFPKLNAEFDLSGEGTNSNPYLVGTCGELQFISQDLSAHYRLTDDIDCTAFSFSPIGNSTTPFTGSLDGDNHTVTGLYLNASALSYVGLFGAISNSQVNDLTINASSVSGVGYVGVLAGRSDNSTISRVTVAGAVYGTSDYVGGLLGYADSTTIRETQSLASVSNTGTTTGGLVGYTNNSKLVTVSAQGAVNGTGNYTGGLVAWNNASTITNSFATGNVTGQNNNVAGLVGLNYSSATINSSYATGAVTSIGNYSNVGGLVAQNSQSSIVSDCYATGAVSAENSSNAGGLVGANYTSSQILNSYSSGSVTSTKQNVGGLAGNNNSATITNAYATSNVSGNSSYASTTGSLVGSQSGTLTNSYYWSGSTCTNCASVVGTAEATLANFYDAAHVVYTTGTPWNFRTLWSATDYSLPTLELRVASKPYAVLVGTITGFDVIEFENAVSPNEPVVTDDGASITSDNELHASWTIENSEVTEYAYCISTSATDCNSGQLLGWTSAGTDTEVTAASLHFTNNTTYYFHVKAKNSSDLWSAIAHSDGILVTLPIIAPNTPTLVSPADGLLTNNNAPTLSAHYYDGNLYGFGTTEYRVATTSAGCIDNSTVTRWGNSATTTSHDQNTTWDVTGVLDTDGTYYWCARNNDGADQSAWTTMGSFTLDTTAPVVQTNALTAPNGGENWAVSTEQTITWDPAKITDANFSATPIKLEYSINGGTSWLTITDATENDGSYTWTPDETTSTDVLVRLIATDLLDQASSDTSDAVFSLVYANPDTTEIISGNNQVGGIGEEVSELKVRIGDGSSYYAGENEVAVTYSITSAPVSPVASGQTLTFGATTCGGSNTTQTSGNSITVYTDADGYACADFTLGDRAGEYEITATFDDGTGEKTKTITVIEREVMTFDFNASELDLLNNPESAGSDAGTVTLSFETNASSYQIVATPNQWLTHSTDATRQIQNWNGTSGFAWDNNSDTTDPTAFTADGSDPDATVVYSCSGDACQGPQSISIDLHTAVGFDVRAGTYTMNLPFDLVNVNF